MKNFRKFPKTSECQEKNILKFKTVEKNPKCEKMPGFFFLILKSLGKYSKILEKKNHQCKQKPGEKHLHLKLLWIFFWHFQKFQKIRRYRETFLNARKKYLEV